ncbi:BRCA1-associated RING domain protein 1 [Mortierella sp. GBA39]|nr:BRCA1-associated RING domain protein 1 [Mortierella sp. GBA39]
MAPFDDALERMEGLLRCPLCSDELHSTYTVKECGHHFCQKCIYPVLGTDCVCPTCDIPARVGNLVKNPSYDILVACVTKLRNIRLAQSSNEIQDTQEWSSQDRMRDLEQGTFIGSPIWSYDCGPTLPMSDHFSSLSNVEAQTFPSVDAAMTMHRRERDIQEKAELKQEQEQEQTVLPSDAKGRGQESSSEDGVIEVLSSQQTELLSDDNHHLAQQPQPPPTISQLQRLLSIRKANSPTPTLRQESERPQDSTPSYGDYQGPSNGVTSNFNTPRMPTPSFRELLLDLGSQSVTDTDQVQDQQISNGPSRKRRMQTNEYIGRSVTPSNGATSRNKKPSRPVPKRELYSSDDITIIRDAQQDIRNPPTSRRRKESVEPENATSGIDDKRLWACTSCPKVMSIGKNVRIYECPACGQNQSDSAGNGGSATTTTDDDEDLGDVNYEYGQVIASSQPTLDYEKFTLPRRHLPFLPVNRAPSRPKPPQLQPQSPHSTTSAPTGSEISTSSPALPSSIYSEPTAAISCVFTGLNKEQKDTFDDNITRVIEAGLFMEHMPDQVFNESATHIITSIDSLVWKRLGVALCPRVLKYLVGMLSNGWVVRHEWFLDSIKAKTWLPLPDERYLIQGDAQFGPAPGTQHRRELRQQHSLKLFDSCRMFFYGEFGAAAQKSIKKQELLRLVQCGGASVLMKRPPKSSSSSSSTRARSRTPIGEASGPNSTNGSNSGVEEDVFFSPNRSFLYITEDTKPWQVPIDKSVPIIVCDPNKIPSGYYTSPSSSTSNESSAASASTALSPTDLKKHGWLRDFQAVSLTWVLNCISCSLMGKADVDLLYGSPCPEEIRELEQAWDSWRSKKS